LVASFAQGGLRDAESLLDQLSLLAGVVTVERIWDLVGSVAEPDLLEILQAIADNQPEALLDAVRRIMDRGREALTLLQNLAGFYRDLLVAKTAPNRSDLVAVTPATWNALCQQAPAWDIPTILLGQQHLAKSEVQIKNTTQPRLWLEVSLLGLLPSARIIRESGVGKRAEAEESWASEPRSRESELHIPKASPTFSGVVGALEGAPVQESGVGNERKNVTSHVSPVVSPTVSGVGKRVEGEVSSPSEPRSRESGVERQQPTTNNTQPTTLNQQHSTNNTQPITNTQESSIPNSELGSRSVAPASTPNSHEEVWLQVLSCLQPHSTQALLKQMGQLIQFDAGIARIGMKSPALRDRAKAYVPNIKAAFLTAFGQDVQVQLELAALPKAERATSSTFASAKIAPANVTEATNSSHNGTATSDRPTTSNGAAKTPHPTPTPQPVNPVRETAANAPPPPLNADAATTPVASTSVGQFEIGEFEIAVQRFAKSFNGEAVGDNTGFISSIDIDSISSAAMPEWEDPDTAEDPELDF
jgi:DNA polymerase-3 subunit gamma/tau